MLALVCAWDLGGFFSIIMLIIRRKILQSPGTTAYFQYLRKRGKNKLKQSEIKVKKIIRMKKQFMVKFINSFYGRY